MSEERDPVCGVNIETGSAAATREYKGEIFYFCSFGCAGDFAADPSRYVGTDRKEDRETPVAQHRHHHETPDSAAAHGDCHGARHHHSGSTGSDYVPTLAKAYYCPMCP